jgi:cytochrome P450
MSDTFTDSPFTTTPGPLDAPPPGRARLRSAGPLARVEAPAGGPVWIVTDAAVAREVLNDPRFAKDPALAPSGWDRRSAGLEPTAAEQLSLTTTDGPPHAALRQAFAPLFSARRMAATADRVSDIARRLLAEVAVHDDVDLMADFSTRYPLTVLSDLLGIPADRVDEAMEARRLMRVDYPAHVGEAMSGFAALAREALDAGAGLVRDLAGRMPAGSSRSDLEYQVFTILYAGQLTTDPAVGFLVADLLHGLPIDDPAALVRDTLTRHPPAPFSLWRFTTTGVQIAGSVLDAGAPVLVDIQGINEQTAPGEPDLTFGAGPHCCIGARHAQLELQALAEAIATDHPDARLLIRYQDLRQTGSGGILGSRLLTLPVALRR